MCSRHEIRPPEIKQVSGINFWMRQWFDDSAMTSEAMRTVRRISPLSTDIVLDIGAHIGSFGWAALAEFNVAKCVFIEADPINVEMLRVNIEQFGDRAVIVPKALVGGSEECITLWRTGYTGCSSIQHKKRFFNVKVSTVNFDEVLDTYRPTLLKVDCEGAEFDFSWNVNPEMREIYAEVHRFDAERTDVVRVRAGRRTCGDRCQARVAGLHRSSPQAPSRVH